VDEYQTMEAILEKNLKDFQVSWPHVRKPRPNTQYSLIVPELPEFKPELPESEVHDPKFG
jgi:hypothetical protein